MEEGIHLLKGDVYDIVAFAGSAENPYERDLGNLYSIMKYGEAREIVEGESFKSLLTRYSHKEVKATDQITLVIYLRLQDDVHNNSVIQKPRIAVYMGIFMVKNPPKLKDVRFVFEGDAEFRQFLKSYVGNVVGTLAVGDEVSKDKVAELITGIMVQMQLKKVENYTC
ncbi:TPA: hypothetical protein DDW69_03920 [candidate division CPR2 bacterium]|uniref:Uncharacterized protein n=1 Tax=candidate division CPR2 bacterium GW2011_GWC1_41_48 TaxID=1618344 RepID=A0A0G0WA75_UNCC2|nr:MAG: hypothetical protein UT47_C0003G0028 [candidate division CPR2 bacterium GW2011_GWC2_39_35]KKR27425.1 MAG: hypothetical protein UT59_C0057G0006 [candidate division CPR2 bacterium GW2011_GWD1_39_7]KKR28602.1 MAG: hypothetical protein UT60_C0016G0002 [candidate division CPR2 bacterium GW2011_GWD2_39_7]KKS08967.1 MAG: hypothetical protein UU65_C0003G0022 [candidate division CPR2 bacterium GW2011_GWC1_41_48]OGB58773.1 MAG: hypothetical protein A2Y27_03810 [candidate division CPR2 bacterium G